MTKKIKRSFIGVLVACIMCLMVCIFGAGTVSATAASAPAFTKAFGSITATTTESGTNIVATSTSGSRVDSVSTYQFGQFEMKFKVASASSLIDFYFTDGTNIKGFVRLFLNDTCLNFVVFKGDNTQKGAVNQFDGGKDNLDYEATIAYDMATKTFSFGGTAQVVVDEQFLPLSGKILVAPAKAANLTITSMQGGQAKDITGPEINVAAYLAETWVGDEITVPTATATDAIDGGCAVTYAVEGPSGAVEVSLGKFDITEVGTYKVTYTAKDTSNNITTREISFTAIATKPEGKTAATLSMDASSMPTVGAASVQIKLPMATATDTNDPVDPNAYVEVRITGPDDYEQVINLSKAEPKFTPQNTGDYTVSYVAINKYLESEPQTFTITVMELQENLSAKDLFQSNHGAGMMNRYHHAEGVRLGTGDAYSRVMMFNQLPGNFSCKVKPLNANFTIFEIILWDVALQTQSEVALRIYKTDTPGKSKAAVIIGGTKVFENGGTPNLEINGSFANSDTFNVSYDSKTRVVSVNGTSFQPIPKIAGVTYSDTLTLFFSMAGMNGSRGELLVTEVCGQSLAYPLVDTVAPTADILYVPENISVNKSTKLVVLTRDAISLPTEIKVELETTFNGKTTLVEGNVFKPTEEGSYSIRVKTTDAAGLSAFTEPFVVTVADTTPPVIQIEDEFKTIYATNEEVTFDGITITDNSGKTPVVTMIIRDEAGNETVAADNKFKFDNEGTYTLIIKASDGNLETKKEVTITVKKNSGCGSVVGSIGAVAVLGLVATALVLRRKKEEA